VLTAMTSVDPDPKSVQISSQGTSRRHGVAVIPERVRQARLEAGLTLAELADGKVSRTAIHLIETGRNRPTLDTLAHIAARTGRPIGYFLGTRSETATPDPQEVSRRAADQLRQASWALGQVLQQPGLTVSERSALTGLLVNVRMGIRLIDAIRSAHP
jgi:transcriptional regulator with XRE-family HTH domain